MPFPSAPPPFWEPIGQKLCFILSRLRPWIILYGHRPMYCSSSDDSDHMCDEDTNPMKNGFPRLGIPGFEKLLWKYNVDVAFWAHEHNFERFWPVYDGKVLNGSREVFF